MPVGAAGRALSQAIQAGQAGARSIGGFGAWFLDKSDRVDARLYGVRAWVVAIAAAVTVAASIVDDWAWSSTPVLTALTTYGFLILVTVLLAVRLGSLRDDEGNWSLALVRRRAKETILAAWGADEARTTLPWSLRWISAGKVTWFLGLVALAIRNAVVLICLTAEEIFRTRLAWAQELGRDLLHGGLGTLVLGTLLWLLGRWLLRREPSAQLRHPNAQDRARLRGAVSALPPIIDCANAAQVHEFARSVGNPILQQLLDTLADWRPRRFDYEDQYQASLHRLLRRRMPGANPQRERPVGSRAEGTAGRADLVVSDAVLIEMKRGLTTSSAQRAVGQVRMYARAWDKGPLMLLLCDADPWVAQQFLGREMMTLRNEAPVILVLAARQSR
jgi:hypothetical protein